jgi:hypothetical protein
MRLFTYIISYLAFFLFTIAILFKIMHWPGASVMLVFAYPIILLAGLFMLIHKYKSDK